MPLSDHEQKLLEQMERALYAEDPKFATQMKGSAARGTARRRGLIGAVVAVLGLVMIVIGVSTELIVVGGIGFAVMVAGAAWALTPPRQSNRVGVVAADGSVTSTRPTGVKNKTKGRTRAKRAGFLHRMEERWERRRRNGPF